MFAAVRTEKKQTIKLSHLFIDYLCMYVFIYLFVKCSLHESVCVKH